jgi:riboflavin biosynthesis pyrimidine reductase
VADVVACGRDAVDVGVMVQALAERGMPQVLCEGGPHLFGALVEADRVDELCLSLSPMIVGGAAGRMVRGASESPRGMRLAQAMTAGDLLLLRYARAR